jgi:hypothetical protein
MTKIEALKKENSLDTNNVSSKDIFGIKTDIKYLNLLIKVNIVL